MISNNGDKFMKNPYFLHSLCTANAPTRSTKELKNYGTISEWQAKSIKKSVGRSKQYSEGIAEGEIRPVRIKKKLRPFSAPKHENWQSHGLKNRASYYNSNNKPLEPTAEEPLPLETHEPGYTEGGDPPIYDENAIADQIVDINTNETN